MKIFLDTNILISGIFFIGNESRVLSLPNIELITSDVAVMELKEVVSRKFASLKIEPKRIAFQEIEKALGDIKVIGWRESARYLKEASELVKRENDRKTQGLQLFLVSKYLD